MTIPAQPAPTPKQRRLLTRIARETDIQLRVAEALEVDLDGREIDYAALLCAMGIASAPPERDDARPGPSPSGTGAPPNDLERTGR